MPRSLLASLATACIVTAGCGGGAAPLPGDAVDLGGGLAMTADGAILGALPLGAPPSHIDAPPAVSAAVP
ncbi:hypothetical protein [Ramlibacter algicola]|uniref:Uncharacterized protein n=1 Tax=Ramlibacter algicola TaxID=2795217 RepID=A0A934Q5F2_9BURK|nr:hypothetical protein [Ramlibacter algicola]MBK0394802.1 hypothetical protein [Ramlibacter algicola]